MFTDRTKALAREFQVDHQVEWLDYVSDKDLIPVLQQSLALVQPSESEGFGLTGLEAMAVGVPVVASDIAVFAEVYGEHTKRFPALDAFALATHLRNLWTHPPKEEERRRWRTHALTFRWETTGEETWKVFTRWM